MARILPNDITPLAFAGQHARELETLDLLRRRLSDDYTVFHSVHWSREYQRGASFGEIDFIIVNQSGDVLVIEQKNGYLQERDGELFKRYDGEDKSVGQQLHRSLDGIRSKWKHQQPRQNALTLDYLVYCPEHRLVRLNSPALDRSRIIDANAGADRLPAQIEALLGPGLKTLDPSRSQAVSEFFADSFDLVPDVHAHADAAQRAYTRLSGGLVKLIDNLEMRPFRLRICGVAGSGKSQVAHRFYDQAIERGKRPLLICFNRPLKDSFAQVVKEGGMVETWYGLCHRFAEGLGHRVDFSVAHRNRDFWRELEELLVATEIPNEWRFDTVIVDEGQDFEPEWRELLGLFQKEGGDLLWLEDPEQNLRGAATLALTDMVTYHARENYRSPHSIATFMRSNLPQDFVPSNDAPGLGVGVHHWEAPEEQVRLVDKVVKDLLRRGFAAEDIVILTCRGLQHSVLSTVDEIAGLPVRRFTGDYIDGDQVWTEGRLTFDSVYRFKGQQAPAVVLVDVDPRAESLEYDQRVMFVGASRATVRLDVVSRLGLGDQS